MDLKISKSPILGTWFVLKKPNFIISFVKAVKKSFFPIKVKNVKMWIDYENKTSVEISAFRLVNLQ